MLVERAYNTSKADSDVLLGSLLGGTNFNYVSHKGCVRRDSSDGRKQWELAEKEVISRKKELVEGAGLTCSCQAKENGLWLTAIPHRLNGTELAWE